LLPHATIDTIMMTNTTAISRSPPRVAPTITPIMATLERSGGSPVPTERRKLTLGEHHLVECRTLWDEAYTVNAST